MYSYIHVYADIQTVQFVLLKVYEEIASHFSGTRHSPWPRISEFLLKQPPASIMADIGCGNGKYLGINKSLYQVRLTRCNTPVHFSNTNHKKKKLTGCTFKSYSYLSVNNFEVISVYTNQYMYMLHSTHCKPLLIIQLLTQH